MSRLQRQLKVALKTVARADESFARGDLAKALADYTKAASELSSLEKHAPKANARVHLRRGLCGQRLRDLTLAREGFEASRRLGRSFGLPLYLAEAARLLGTLDEQLGALDRADDHLREALVAYGEAGSVEGAVTALNALGRVARGRQDFEQALERFEQAERMASSEGFLAGRADALANLGNLHRVQADLQAAQAAFEGVLAVAEATDDDGLRARAHIDLGNVAAADERPDEAVRCYEAALALQQARGDALGIASSRCNLANLWLREGRIRESVEAYQAALSVAHEQGSARMRVDVALMLAHALGAAGDTLAAADVLEGALSQAQQLNYAAGEVRAEGSLASLALTRGFVEESRRRHAGVVAALRDGHRPADEVSALLGAIGADLAADDLAVAQSRLERVEHVVLSRNMARHRSTLHAASASVQARLAAHRGAMEEAADVIDEAASRLHTEGFPLDALRLSLSGADYRWPLKPAALLEQASEAGARGLQLEIQSLLAVIDAGSEADFDALVETSVALGQGALAGRIRRRRAECHDPTALPSLANEAAARGAMWEARLCRALGEG